MKLIIILLIFIIIFLNLILNDKIENTENMSNLPVIDADDVSSNSSIAINDYININFEDKYNSIVKYNTPFTISFLFKLNNYQDYSSQNAIILNSVEYKTIENDNIGKGYIIFLKENIEDRIKKVNNPSNLYIIFYDKNKISEFVVSKQIFRIGDKLLDPNSNSKSNSNSNSNSSPNQNNDIDLITNFIEEENYNNIYYHFATSQNYSSIDIFLDGLRATINFPSNFQDDNLILKTSYIGNIPKSLSDFLDSTIFKDLPIKPFEGDIKFPEFFKNYKNSRELCSKFNSCGISTCNYFEGGGKTNNRDDCYEDCSKNDNCSENECYNKCYNISMSNWSSCDFKPLGKDLNDCLSICSKNNSCSFGDCQIKCNNCKDSNICYWIKPLRIKQTIKTLLFTEPPLKYSNLKPMYSKIVVRPQKKKGTVKVLFSTPNLLDYNGNFIKKSQTKDNSIDLNNQSYSNTIDTFYKDPRITAFIYVLHKHDDNQPTKNIKIGLWKAKYSNININDLNKDDYLYRQELTGLDPDAVYTIFIRAYRPNKIMINGREKYPNVNLKNKDLDIISNNDDSFDLSIQNNVLFSENESLEEIQKLSDISNIVTFQAKKNKNKNLLNKLDTKSLEELYNFKITGQV